MFVALAAIAMAAVLAGCSPPNLPLRPPADGGTRESPHRGDSGRVAIMPSAGRSPEASGGVEHRTGRFRGADGVVLFEQSWRPTPRPAAAVLVIHHGLKSHSAHHGELAARLAGLGAAVYAYDMRGHGRSPGVRAAIDDVRDLTRDLDRFLARVRRAEPGAPIFLAGHSVGGAVVALYALEQRPDLAGLILLAPALRVDQPPIAAAAAEIAGRVAPNAPAVDVPNEWFARSAEVRREMDADPLIYQPAGPARTARALTDALAVIWARAGELDLPLLALHGTADRATSPRGTAELVHRARTRDRTLLLYRGLTHDLVREPERDQVMTDIERWIGRRIRSRYAAEPSLHHHFDDIQILMRRRGASAALAPSRSPAAASETCARNGCALVRSPDDRLSSLPAWAGQPASPRHGHSHRE